MTAKIVSRNQKTITIQIQIPVPTGNMLESEDDLQRAINEAGMLGTSEIMSHFDVHNRKPVVVKRRKLTYKHKVAKRYETPYGAVTIERSVYQGGGGGATWSPLDHNAGIVGSTTPKLAKMVSWKYSKMAAPAVQEDLKVNHNRRLSLSYIKHLSDDVGHLAGDHKQDTYDIPEMDRPVAAIAIGLDGTCMLLCEDGWREAMCGTISLYDDSGNRQHTIYTAAAPEYGKEQFRQGLEQEIRAVQARYPNVPCIGVADGARENWLFLKKHTSFQILDFYHLSEYVSEAAHALFPEQEADRKLWLESWLHRLKHKQGAACRLLRELESADLPKKTTVLVEKLYRAVSYLKNNHALMRYSRAIKENWPIGSGVTEAACKTLVKQRLCSSGMRWKHDSAAAVLRIRALTQTKGRWEQFWQRLMNSRETVEPVY